MVYVLIVFYIMLWLKVLIQLFYPGQSWSERYPKFWGRTVFQEAGISDPVVVFAKLIWAVIQIMVLTPLTPIYEFFVVGEEAREWYGDAS